MRRPKPFVKSAACLSTALFIALATPAGQAGAQGVEWQVHEGEQVQIASLTAVRIYRICLHSEMFGMKTTFEPKVRTLTGVYDLKLAHLPNTVRCIDIEAKRIDIIGGDKVSDPKRIAFGTYELVL